MRAFEAILNLVASLAWPAVAVLALIQFKGPLSGLLERLKSAALPGGVNLDFDEQLLDAKLLAKDIEDNPDQRSEEHKRIPQTEANKRLIELNLRPSPSGLNFGEYRDIANNDPILALASLRTEMDAMIKNLADGFKIDVGGIGSSEGMLEKLHREGAVYTRQFDLGRRVIKLCNAAIHGTKVSRSEAEAVVDIAEVLASEYLDWLGWGFPKTPHSKALA